MSPVVLLALGGFLLGGAIALLRSPERTRNTVVVAVILLLASVLAIVSGVLRLA